MPASALAAAKACGRARALGVRYPGAAAGADEAHSRQRHWCLWSKLERGDCGDVGTRVNPQAMVYAVVELRYGVMARKH